MRLQTLFRALAAAALFALLSGCNLIVFNPKGQIATQERDLIILATGLMLLVVIPVIILTFVFAWRYRATNKNATYMPNWASSYKVEVMVWGLPLIIILILGIVTWKSTHLLDPYRPLDSDVAPINVQVIAVDWKWVFIYPDLGIASVNELAMPVHTPVSFTITSDAAMTSFFIPALGGQIYAMAGMQTKLHLIANEAGNYTGIAANYNGRGFSDMHFATLATPPEQFEQWAQKVRGAPQTLDRATYDELARPTTGHPVVHYHSVDAGLFNTIVDKYQGMNKRPPTSEATQAPQTETSRSPTGSAAAQEKQ